MMDEKCVMNSYFGIGIDAKITLDFHTKREEHPEKCRSRARNYMWYGVLGSKEWLQASDASRTLRRTADIFIALCVCLFCYISPSRQQTENVQEPGTARAARVRRDAHPAAESPGHRRAEHPEVKWALA